VVSHPGYETRIPKLGSNKNLKAATALLRGDRSIRAGLMRDRIAEIRRLDHKVAGTEKQIAKRVRDSGSSLTRLRGIGFIVAAMILGEVGDVSRLRSEGSFAMLTAQPRSRPRRERPNATGSAQLRPAHDGPGPLSRRCGYQDLHGTAPDAGQVRQGGHEVFEETAIQCCLQAPSRRWRRELKGQLDNIEGQT
jgi:hypothetical protein